MELTLNLTQHETTAEQSYAGVRVTADPRPSVARHF